MVAYLENYFLSKKKGKVNKSMKCSRRIVEAVKGTEYKKKCS